MSTYNVVTSAPAETSARGQSFIIRLLLGLLRFFGYTPEQPPQGQVVVRITNLEQVNPDTGLTELGRAIVGKADLAYIRTLVRLGADFTTRHSILVKNSTRAPLVGLLCGPETTTIGSPLEQALYHNLAALILLREERPEAVQLGLNHLLWQIIGAANNASVDDKPETRNAFTQNIRLALVAGARFNESSFFELWDAIKWSRLPKDLGLEAMATKPTLDEVFEPFIWYSFDGYAGWCKDRAEVMAANKKDKPLQERPGFNNGWTMAPRDMPEDVLLQLFHLGVPFHQIGVWASDSILEFCMRYGYARLAEAIIAKAPEVVPTAPEAQQALLSYGNKDNPVVKLLLAHPAFQTFALEAQPNT